ncbi:response regulator transcription factor [Burkholderia cepacia]|uniref:response regulator transcription factor n=1 Tax=Burkholderia cepacia TaxID=292 RepID=UPI001C96CF2D|nr:response regulator transcription factor [Burkholderia cepacia]MBY4806087.1 response regulator transcription factor [Burkholderia cepacia]
MKILLLEDDVAMSDFVGLTLGQHGCHVEVCRDGASAVRKLEKSVFDLVILEWATPLMSGMDVLKWIRRNIGDKLPVLFLTNRIFEQCVAEALNAGADDYVLKPIGPEVLLARVRSNTRRANSGCELPELIEVGSYLLDEKVKNVYLKGVKIPLTEKEFGLAAILFKNLGRAVPRDHIFKILWGKNEDRYSRSLDTHVYRIRSKLALHAENGVSLKSVYTVGYRLETV